MAIIEQMESGLSSKKFTEDLFNSWGVGDKKCNNGAVFMISIKDRQWFGYFSSMYLLLFIFYQGILQMVRESKTY